MYNTDTVYIVALGKSMHYVLCVSSILRTTPNIFNSTTCPEAWGFLYRYVRDPASQKEETGRRICEEWKAGRLQINLSCPERSQVACGLLLGWGREGCLGWEWFALLWKPSAGGASRSKLLKDFALRCYDPSMQKDHNMAACAASAILCRFTRHSATRLTYIGHGLFGRPTVSLSGQAPGPLPFQTTIQGVAQGDAGPGMAHGTRNAGEEMVGESCLPINLVCDSAVALCIFPS